MFQMYKKKYSPFVRYQCGQGRAVVVRQRSGWEWWRQRVQAVESDLNDDATLPVSIHIPNS